MALAPQVLHPRLVLPPCSYFPPPGCQVSGGLAAGPLGPARLQARPAGRTPPAGTDADADRAQGRPPVTLRTQGGPGRHAAKRPQHGGASTYWCLSARTCLCTPCHPRRLYMHARASAAARTSLCCRRRTTTQLHPTLSGCLRLASTHPSTPTCLHSPPNPPTHPHTHPHTLPPAHNSTWCATWWPVATCPTWRRCWATSPSWPPPSARATATASSVTCCGWRRPRRRWRTCSAGCWRGSTSW